MAESQGVNGDIWNDHAVKLMELFGWDHIGDKNMDLSGSDGKEYGVDALMLGETPHLDVYQTCVLESKRYATSSLSQSVLKKWIETLRKKLELFSNSSELYDEFPSLREGSNANLGVIMCWVHDAINEDYFEETFNGLLRNCIINTQPNNKLSSKRIVVFSNPKIVRLAAVAEKILKNPKKYRFVYPSQLLGGKPMVKSNVLTIEYAMSDFILAERQKDDRIQNIVFFIGKISSLAFQCLYDALLMYNFIEKDKEIVIYYYGTQIDNRLAIAEGKRIFKDIDPKFVSLTSLNLTSEPSILSINDDDDE